MAHPSFCVPILRPYRCQKQSLAVRRRIDATVTAHITVRHDLVDLPLRAHRAVDADLVNVRHVLGKTDWPSRAQIGE